MSNVSPSRILAQVAESVPHDCLTNIIVIGSLAAGYRFFAADKNLYVRTKDIDSVLRPRNKAVESGRAVAEKLLASGWHHRKEGDHTKPGDKNTPDDKLPAIRLVPPNEPDWFVELLTEPEEGDTGDRRWLRLELSTGHFGLPSFAFLTLTTFRPIETDFGLYCARPEMMALANLLEHRSIRPERMSGLIEGRSIKRSNKDLGRVLALARLSGPDKVETWADEWNEAVATCFPKEWKSLAAVVGDGIRGLLASSDDLQEAAHSCNNGLLAARPVTVEQLAMEGQRLLLDAIEPMEYRAKG